MSKYLELLAAYGLPLDQKFTDHLWNKYLDGGFEWYDIDVKKDEQKMFESLMLGTNSIWLSAIQIEINGNKYTFKKDTQVLEIFNMTLIKLQKEWKKKNTPFLHGARQHEFYIQVKNLNEYLDQCFTKHKVIISTRKIHILIYDLMSLFLADSPGCSDIFPAARPNEPKLDTDQIKAARIKSILKTPKIVKLRKRNS